MAYMTAPDSKHPSSNPADASYWAAVRASNGHPAPYDVPYWEVGNEQFFPGQYGWRGGAVVNVGPHSTACPPATATCLYVFGGTTYFSLSQWVLSWTSSDRLLIRMASSPGFLRLFPPGRARSLTVYVAGKAWSEVANLAVAGP